MSKLRSDELVNMEGDGAPSFPRGATSIEPTADNQVATKLYVDTALSASFGNAVSNTAPTNPAIGSFWTDTSVNPSALKTWDGTTWIEFAGTAAAAVGVVVSLPSLSATNLEHAPATITASAAQVSNATLFITKWYKDDVEIVGATGSTYVATEPGVYRYEERWADDAGNILTPSLNKTIELLSIEAPSITIPVAGTGLPDFDYTAESSAITNVGTVDALSDEEAFNTYLAPTSVSDQALNIDNGMDFATHGGLIWLKSRGGNKNHVLIDTERGANTALFSNNTNSNSTLTGAPYASSFDSDGFTWGSENNFHPTGQNYVAWSFLKTQGYFDVVTFTGNGSTQTISHNLGSVPAMMIIKDISRTEDWMIYHHSLSSAYGNPYPAEQLRLRLNEPDATPSSDPSMWNSTAPTSTEFSVGNSSNTNHSGDEYVAYLFADNSSNEIKCGSYLGNAVGGGSPAVPNQIDCGFRPKFVLIKNVGNSADWLIFDDQRSNYWLKANSADSEAFSPDPPVVFNDNGFSLPTGYHHVNQDNTEHIYLAIGSPKITVSNTQLTLTDTTVSKISDGSLVGGSTIDQVLTVGEIVQSETSSVIASAQVWSDNLTNISPINGPAVYGGTSAFDGNASSEGFTNGFNNIMQWTFSNLFGTLIVYGDPNQNHEKTIDGVSIGSEVSDSEGRIVFNITESNTAITLKNVGRTYYTIARKFELNGFTIINNQPISAPTASGTVSASSGNTITLSNTTGTWSTGMKVQGVTTDTKDYPDPIAAGAVTFASSQPVVTSGTVNTWDYAEWNLSYDAQFSSVVHEKAVPLTATGTQAGPDSFPIQPGTEYFVRTKYASFLPSGQSDWSAVTRFLTKETFYVDDLFSTFVYEGNGGTQTINNGMNLGSTVGSLSGQSIQETQSGVDFNTPSTNTGYNSGISWQDVITDGTLSGTNSNFLYSYNDALDIYVDLGEAVVATSFEIAPQGDTSNGATYNVPQALNLYGSNDASSWTSLYQTSAASSNFAFYPGRLTSIPFSNSTAYRYYRLESGTGTSISEWQIPRDSGTPGEGGLVWIKNRSSAIYGGLWDTERGADERLRPDSNIAEATASNILTSFNSNGFSISTTGGTQVNNSGDDYVSWTFRKAPKFFDIVTYTGSGANRSIAHSLGSVPGCIMIKCTSRAGDDWIVYHQSLGNAQFLNLNQTYGASTDAAAWNSSTPTSSVFYLGTKGQVNTSGESYVAYIFANDDQSFGADGDESIIKCGYYFGNDSTDGPEINLGFEPQFVMIKSTTASYNWFTADNMRGVPTGGTTRYLNPNTSGDEVATANEIDFTPTGFKLKSGNAQTNNPETYIYMAIRRPHKPATVATDVFAIDNGSGSSTIPTWDSGFPVDMSLFFSTAGGYNRTIATRLMDNYYLNANSNSAQATDGSLKWDSNEGWGTGYQTNFYSYMFRRSPGFFDMVTWTGNGTQRTISHNLGVAPELIIVKARSNTMGWPTWHKSGTDDSTYGRKTLMLNTDAGESLTGWFTTDEPTSTVFSLSSNNQINSSSGYTYIGYLFASQSGVSKVGSYTGTGSNVDVDCGFAAGARFILIKRTDSTGDWYMWDTERGITGDNDPYSLLNTTDIQVTNTDYIDPLNAGFTVTSSAPAELNTSGGTYLFLAIA